MPSSRQENLEIPTQFRYSEQFDGFCHFSSDSGREMRVESFAGARCSFSKIKMTKKCLFGLRNEGRRLAMARKKDHRRAFQPKVYATKTERCPVKFYKTFKSHKPVEMNQPDRKIPIHGGPKKLVSTGRGNELPTIRFVKRVFPGYSMLIFQRTPLLNSEATKARKAYNNTNQPAPRIKQKCR